MISLQGIANVGITLQTKQRGVTILLEQRVPQQDLPHPAPTVDQWPHIQCARQELSDQKSWFA